MEPEKINIAIYWPGKVQVESRGGGLAVYPCGLSFTETCQKHLDTLAKTMGHTSTAVDKSDRNHHQMREET